MIKELIRNGSFERGNLDFWDIIHGNAIIDSAVKVRGNYSAKILTGADNVVSLATKDYIGVSEGEVYRAMAYMKNVDMTDLTFTAVGYDVDLDELVDEAVTLDYIYGVSDWALTHTFFVIPPAFSYVRLGFVGSGAAGKYGYVDTVSLQRIDMEKLAALSKLLVHVTDLTAKDTYYSDDFFTGIWKVGEFVLRVTSLTGTVPTLDVTIEAYYPETQTWITIITFTQATGVTTEKKQNVNDAYIGLGWLNRVKYVLGGTEVTDCDFRVGVVYKR